VRDRIRVKHYSIRTETQYVQWIKRFSLFHNKRHPQEMGAAEVEAFLTHLAVAGHISASTQNQALSALLFLYKGVLAIDLPWLNNGVRAKQSQRLPVVLTRSEVREVLARKYPNVGTEWCWQYIFPSGSYSVDHTVAWSAAIILTRNYCNGR